MKRTTRTNSRKTSKTTTRASKLTEERAPLIEHLKELRRRVVYIVLSVLAMSALVYSVERPLIDILLKPSHGQHFVYTSPMGGINFLFNVCFYFGIALTVPVIIYNLLKFIQPLMRYATQRFIVVTSTISGVIAMCGILFGYFVGLPAALHFLLGEQFHNGQIQPLISIQAYFSFVVSYMFGAALMFQLPLILVIINRIKPLSPQKMFRYERGVIIFAFVAAFIMNPTPNLISQLLTVVPVLISYQLGIAIVWLLNRRSVHRRYRTLFDKDAAIRAERQAKARAAIPLPPDKLDPVTHYVDPLAMKSASFVGAPPRSHSPYPTTRPIMPEE